MATVLIVENDQRINSHYCSFLEKQGYKVIGAYDAAQALQCFQSDRIDIIMCSILMPNIDGVMAVEAIRSNDQEVPIIMVTELDDLRSKQRAFAAGCDDYMVKPIDLNELALRIAALLRRSHAASQLRVTIGNATLDSSLLAVTEGPNTLVLPPKEFKILFKLCASPGRIFTRRDIMNDIWDIGSESNERTVDVHIKRLRKRFEDSQSFRIDTVRGVGYKATPLH